MSSAVRFKVGSKGEIWLLIRDGGSPAREFIASLPELVRKQFERAWEQFVEEGRDNVLSSGILKPLFEGKGLWYFEEQSYRLFCCGTPSTRDGLARIILLSGCMGDDTAAFGKGLAEARALWLECLSLDWRNAENEAFKSVEPPFSPSSTPRLDGELINITDLAKLAGVHRATIYKWIKDDKLPPPAVGLKSKKGGRAAFWPKTERLVAIAKRLAES